MFSRHSRAPAVPSLRQPGPQQAIDSGETKSLTAGTICNCQLVAKREDLHVQSRARTDQQPERVEERNDEGPDEPSLFGTACNLNRHKAYRVFGRHSRPNLQTAMPRYDLSTQEVLDLARYVHYLRQTGRYADLTAGSLQPGDPEQGEAYFARRCGQCHSVTADLAGITRRNLGLRLPR